MLFFSNGNKGIKNSKCHKEKKEYRPEKCKEDILLEIKDILSDSDLDEKEMVLAIWRIVHEEL